MNGLFNFLKEDFYVELFWLFQVAVKMYVAMVYDNDGEKVAATYKFQKMMKDWHDKMAVALGRIFGWDDYKISRKKDTLRDVIAYLVNVVAKNPKADLFYLDTVDSYIFSEDAEWDEEGELFLDEEVVEEIRNKAKKKYEELVAIHGREKVIIDGYATLHTVNYKVEIVVNDRFNYEKDDDVYLSKELEEVIVDWLYNKLEKIDAETKRNLNGFHNLCGIYRGNNVVELYIVDFGKIVAELGRYKIYYSLDVDEFIVEEV